MFSMLSRTTRELGTAGETAALNHYLSQKYKLVDKNWRIRQGEIDLILWKNDILVFVEVKTRTDSSFATPLEQITYAKQKRLLWLAEIYLGRHSLPKKIKKVRIDIAEVIGNGPSYELRLIENAISRS